MFRLLPNLSLVLENEAVRKGRNAYFAGQPVSANPFSPQTSLHQDWMLGWKDGLRETEALKASSEQRDVG